MRVEPFNGNQMQTTQGGSNYPAIPQPDNRGIISDVIKGYSNTVSTVPNVMVEQRNSFMAMFDVMDKMENMGMIKINRPQPVQDDEVTFKDFLIGLGTIAGIIGLIVVL